MSSETNNAVEPAFRSGFVALVGRPNAGKSRASAQEGCK